MRTKKGVRRQLGGIDPADQNNLTHDEGIVMLFQLIQSTVCCVCCHEGAYRPLINRAGSSISLIERRRDKRFQHKPPPNIHATIDGRQAKIGSMTR